jgi:hypothetical protein
MIPSCPKCDRPLLTTHTPAMCQFGEWRKQMITKRVVDFSNYKELEELLTTDIPRDIYKWPLNPNRPGQGYFRIVYFPEWVANVLNLWHQYRGFTLKEFIAKMDPRSP